MTDIPPNRFAVAAFDTWPSARSVAENLCSGPHPLRQISYLALQSAFNPPSVQCFSSLPFPGNVAPLVCSPGPIADRLADRLDAGTPSLKAALATWLIPRHAAQLQRTVNNGYVVLWVQLVDNADERRAYRILMEGGCVSVGVHDLVGG